MTTTQIAIANLSAYLSYSKLGFEAELGGLIELLTGACDATDEQIGIEIGSWRQELMLAKSRLEEGPDDCAERWEIECLLLRNAVMALNVIS